MRHFLFKLTIILFVITTFMSCVSTQLTPREEEFITFGIDFRKYTEKEFLFMPGEYYGEYDVKGIITAELHPKVSYSAGAAPTDAENYVIKYFKVGEQEYMQIVKKVDLDQLIEYIYNIAVEWGGDGFTNFDSNIGQATTDSHPSTSYNYYSISGIVIKRK